VDMLACGFDPKRSALFLQTDVPAVTNLPGSCRRSRRWGYRARPFLQGQDRPWNAASAGLFTYPVLMAADILI
jgi:tryptophanyl-tRNA synthetase